MKPKYESRLIPQGHVLTQAELDALPDPERLIAGRHCRRNAEGRLVARREFLVAIPTPSGKD